MFKKGGLRGVKVFSQSWKPFLGVGNKRGFQRGATVGNLPGGAQRRFESCGGNIGRNGVFTRGRVLSTRGVGGCNKTRFVW